jgi:hypothetical protein
VKKILEKPHKFNTPSLSHLVCFSPELDEPICPSCKKMKKAEKIAGLGSLFKQKTKNGQN